MASRPRGRPFIYAPAPPSAQAAVDFKCPECIDNTDLRDGSVDEAKLDSALQARLADMEARIAAIEGLLGSISTGFVGTYRCHQLNVGQYGGETYTGINLHGYDFEIQADGAGSATITHEEQFTGGAYWGVEYVDPAYQLRTQWNPPDPYPDETLGYSVSSDGEILLEGEKAGYVSQSGEVATFYFAENDPEGLDTFAPEISMAVCVRTSVP